MHFTNGTNKIHIIWSSYTFTTCPYYLQDFIASVRHYLSDSFESIVSISSSHIVTSATYPTPEKKLKGTATV